MEKWIDFWSAYLLCLCMFVVGIIVLIVGKKYYVVRPPRGSVIPNAFRALWIGIVNKGNMGESPFCFCHGYLERVANDLHRRCETLLPGRVRAETQDALE